MTRYIALLRGINVSGQKLIKMEDLRQMFAAAGFSAVQTYIQSGNVIFEAAESDPATLRPQVEEMLAASLGYKVPTLIRTIPEMNAVIRDFPFAGTDLETVKLYVAFLADVPHPEKQSAWIALSNTVEVFHIRDREAYISILKETDQKVLFTNMLLEKKLGVVATTRNWATVNKLAGY